MEKDYTLTVRLRPPLHDNLTRYSKRTGLTLAGAVRCWVTGLDGGGDADDAEIDALIAKLQAKRAKRLPAPPRGSSGVRADADGGSEERKGGGE